MMAKKIQNFFTKEEQANILLAIKKAEMECSGEIRLHLDNKCKGSELDRAAQVFKVLKMHQTELRNGVLIYLAVEDRKFAIIGDIGIHEKVGDSYWQDVRDIMLEEFLQQNFEQGIVKAIERIGDKLKEHFPYQEDDVNELSDDISFGK